MAQSKAGDMIARAATEEDLDDITRIHVAAVPMDPECPYRYPYREEYAEDHWQFSRIEYASYLHDQLANVILIEMSRDSNDEDSRPRKPVAFSVCHLPGSHIGKSTESDARKVAVKPTPETSSTTLIRRDANLTRVAAFQESISQAKNQYFTAKYGEQQVYLGMVACHPRYQRRGAGGKLLRSCIQTAVEAGQLPVTLCASPIGMPLYRRLGFEVVGEFRTQVEGEEEFLLTPCMVLEQR